MKANFRSSQLSLQIAPAAEPPTRTTLRDDLPEQLARLTEAERTILRLKALVGVATNKSDFLTMANASVSAGPGGSLTYNTVNPMLNRLLSLGLLNADFSCPELLRHPLAIEMIAAPEGPKAAEAVRRIFLAAARSVYYSYSPQSDPGARAMRLDLPPTISQALKLYTKEVGRRKVFFEGSNGLFFLLALIRANDLTLHAEIQRHLDAVDRAGNPFSVGFQAILAMLHLLRGAEPKARALLDDLRKFAVHEPVSAACVALAEFLIDPALAKARIKDTEARFAALARTLPLVARVHAEILAKISGRPAPYEDFLRDAPDGGPLIAFTELVELQQPWERSLEGLANFLGAGATAPAAAPAAQKSRRLVWFVDPELKLIEAVEQSAKGANGWTSGRNVAMKRLHEQDPRLDYLSDHDRRALRTIRKTSVGWYGQENYDFDPYATLLALVDHPLVYDYRRRDQRLELVSHPVELVVSERADGYRFTLSHQAAEPTVFLEAETPTRWRVVDFASRLLAIQEILGAGGLIVPRQGRERVMALVRVQHPSLPIRADIADADLPAISGRPEPVLQIQPLEEGLKVTMVTRPFGPTGPFYLVGLGGKSVLATIDGARQRANRDLDAERVLAGALLADLTILEGQGSAAHEWTIEDAGSALEFLLQLHQRQPPIAVEWPEGKRLSVRAEVSASNLSLKIARARDWFQMDGEVSVDGELVLDMRDLLSRLDRAQGRFVPLADGSFLALTERFRKQLQRLSGISEDHGKGRRMPILAGVAARDLAEDAGQIKADKEWKGFVERLSDAGRRQPEPPSTLQAELRDYQLEGFRWLSRLAHWQAGACLADDMGLGKTVQAIAAMLEQAPHGPCLVIAPTSVCHNWENELTRFAPTLAIRRLGAAGGRAEILAGLKAMDALVLSYGLLHQEADRLADIDWRMIVFDEAQAIKNAENSARSGGTTAQGAFSRCADGNTDRKLSRRIVEPVRHHQSGPAGLAREFWPPLRHADRAQP